METHQHFSQLTGMMGGMELQTGTVSFSLYLGLEKAFPSLQVPVQCTLGCGLVYACPAKAAAVQDLQGNEWEMSGLFRSTP